MKRSLLGVSLAVALVSSAILAFAPGQQQLAIAEEELVEVGNKVCPICEKEIEEEAYKVEHDGKIYNLHCKMCTKDFEKDAHKYVEKLEKM